MNRAAIAAIGEIIQLSYVPADVPAALKFWTETIGAGPFVALDHVQSESCHYKGAPTEIDFSIYIGYWGEMQIEIVEQHNDAPSIYKDWRDAGMEGVNHVCIVTDDITKSRALFAERGATVLQELKLGGGGEAFYADTGGGPGTIVEVLKPAPGVLEAFAYIKSLSVAWDGSDPVRRLG